MIANTSFHRRGNPERLVCTAEVIEHEVQRQCVFVILNFLRESIGEPSEAAHVHAHGKILPLDVASRDVFSIGRLFMPRLCQTAQALSRTISYPLKHMVPCNPSDWGVGMTVCIASMCYQGDCIIGVSDRMLSMPTMSVDDLAVKFSAIGNSWMAMFAGNDISPVVPIFKEVRAAVVSTDCQETLEDIVGYFKSAIQKQMTTKAETTTLSKFGLDITEFRRNGLADLGPELFTRLAYEIEQISLDLIFLIFGFDGADKEGHIFTVDGIGEVSYYDIGGFWAIGSGQTSALGTLFGTRIPVPYNDLSDAFYLLAKAKFSAETAIGVGKESTAMILQSNSERYLLHAPEMQKIKEKWEASRGLDVPNGVNEIASKLLTEAKDKFYAASRS